MKKITATLLNQRNIQMRLHVNIKVKDMDGSIKPCITELTYNNETQLKVDSKPYITLEMKTKKDEQWTRYKSVMLFNSNIPQLLYNCKMLQSDLLRDDLYYLKANKTLQIYSDTAEKTKRMISMGLNQQVLIKPTIIYDENDEAIEGILMCFYNMENNVHLTLDEFDELIYVLSKIDLFGYSQTLLTQWMLYSRKNHRDIESDKKQIVKRNVFDKAPEEKVTATGNVKDTNPFEGLEE